MEQYYELIGDPCAYRGPYKFYKGFKYKKNNVTNIVTINEFFFVKLWSNSDLICIGELRLLWNDSNCDQTLASLRLYILPENTPEGRISDLHGEDEVLAITEKVVIRLADLLTWITEATDWNWGLNSIWLQRSLDIKNERTEHSLTNKKNGILCETNELENDFNNERISTLADFLALDYSDIYKQKRHLDMMNWESKIGVVVLSYSSYCRYRGLMKRLEGVHNEWLKNKLIRALGGFTTNYRTTKILFCKDTFDYPDLEGHELLCNHLAPKLTGSEPKKKKSSYSSPDRSDNDNSSDYLTEDDDSSSTASSVSANSRFTASRSSSSYNINKKNEDNRLKHVHLIRPNESAVNRKSTKEVFIHNLFVFMEARCTPITRLPSITEKEIDLFELYNTVKHFGGYVSVSNNKLWRYIYKEMGGCNDNQSTAALTKKHYEKYLLPYEQYLSQLKSNNGCPCVIKTPLYGTDSSTLIHLPTKECEITVRVDKNKQQDVYSSNMLEMTESSNTAAVLATRNNVNLVSTNSGKTGDKENIPLAAKKSNYVDSKVFNISGSAEIIDLGNQQNSSFQNSNSSPSVEIIDLCDDSPMKLTVPSTTTFTLPRKRKLDILREGGLEVTPISSSIDEISTKLDTVTVPKKNASPPNVHSKYSNNYNSVYLKNFEADTSIELLDSSFKNSPRKSTTDLRFTKNNGGYVSRENLIKKLSPNLGPNIEISLVPTNGDKNSEKKPKTIPLPIPALRKITTGELSVKNLVAKVNSSANVTVNNKKSPPERPFVKPLVSLSSSSFISDSTVVGVNNKKKNILSNDSYCLAGVYSSVSPNSMPASLNLDEDELKLQLTEHQVNYLRKTFLNSSKDSFIVSNDVPNDTFSQNLSNAIKSGSLSIVENYEKISPN